MNFIRALSVAVFALSSSAACSDDSEDGEPAQETPDPQPPAWATVVDVADVKANPDDYEWFDFRPNVLKLILAGAAETQHIAILWYTVTDGAVGLHLHSMTESVYVIDGTQTDAKGSYPTGTVYFNPPGSGHAISDSSGFFLLAYASPPDFANTDAIGEYEPIRVDTTSPDLTTTYPFDEQAAGVGVFAVPLDSSGGMSARFIRITASEAYAFDGNYLLVLDGTCEVGGAPFDKDELVVAKTIEPESYVVTTPEDGSCLALAISF